MPVIRVVAALVVDAAGRMCLVRKRGTTAFMQPGGKPEAGETAELALVRELAEELALDVPPAALEPLGRFEAAAANEAGHVVVADVFRLVTAARPGPHAEIEEVRWADAAEARGLGDRLAPLARRLLPLAAPDPAGDRVRAAYDAVADAYAGALPDLRAEAPPELDLLQRWVDRLTAGARVLDAGCGAGRLLAHLGAVRPDLALTGVDLSPAMANLAARAAPSATVVRGDLAALPFPDGAFDGVLAWYSLIHLAPAAVPGALAELRRVLAPGGLLLTGFQAGSGERRIARAYGRDVELVAHRHAVEGVAVAALAAGLRPEERLERAPAGAEGSRQGFLLARAVPLAA